MTTRWIVKIELPQREKEDLAYLKTVNLELKFIPDIILVQAGNSWYPLKVSRVDLKEPGRGETEPAQTDVFLERLKGSTAINFHTDATPDPDWELSEG